MKKLIFLTVCLVAFAANGFAQKSFRGEKGVSSVGLIMGHAVSSKAFTLGADFRYNIEDKIRLAPSALYTLKNDNFTSLYLNADAHYLTRVTKDITIFPIGGVGVSLRKIYGIPVLGIGGVELKSDSETKLRVGLNLGFGGEIRATDDIIIGAEFKYNLTTERIYDQAMLLARVAYYF